VFNIKKFKNMTIKFTKDLVYHDLEGEFSEADFMIWFSDQNHKDRDLITEYMSKQATRYLRLMMVCNERNTELKRKAFMKTGEF
jgi:hypothetical protein